MAVLIQEGGPTMLLLLALAAPAVGLAIAHAAVARGWSRWAAGSLFAIVISVSLAGTLLGRHRTDRACDDLAVSDRPIDFDLGELRARGYAEANRPVELGGLLAALCLVPLVIGELRLRRRSA
jgi:hypothetical protein